MTTKKPQILLTLDDDRLKRIDDYRFNKRIISRSETIRQLIEAGLNVLTKPKSKKK
jgi:metal-responsive CopG/Arc/MetJ family transcriptional regulator